MEYAPIVLFAYNRPMHTMACIQSLLQNKISKNSDIYFYIDGPKTKSDIDANIAICEYLKSLRGFKNTHVIQRQENVGLARSIVDGINNTIFRHGKVIVIEDDLILSRHFLEYMNDGLILYKDREDVLHISGYMFPIEETFENTTYLLPLVTSWGWGTWKSAWNFFGYKDTYYSKLKKSFRLRRKFNLNNSFDYWGLLKKQLNGDINSWAIIWYLSFFFQKGLALYPSHSLVYNAGFDGSGVHCTSENKFENKEIPGAGKIPIFMKSNIDTKIYRHVRKTLRSQSSTFRLFINSLF